MRVIGLTILLLLAVPVIASADDDYDALLEAHKAKRYGEALDKAEAFILAHADHRYAGAACWMGGNAGLNTARYDRSAALYRKLLDDYPESRHCKKGRDELVTVLDSARRLDECIAQCETNLLVDPDADATHRWRYMIGQCRFRKWEFKQAETDLKAFKKDFPKSTWVNSADYYLARINPPLKADKLGIVEGYKGKYVDDDRFKAALKAMPGWVAEAFKTLKETLGVEITSASVLYVFEDKGYTRDSNRAFVETIAIDYKPVTRMTFYTEHIVVSEYDFRSRLVHELKHAAFRDLMGEPYVALPNWVREGLAVYGAQQSDDRLAAIAGGEIFSGRDPYKLLDGIDDADHDINDYLEDAAAFLWLESLDAGNVKAYCKRLLKGQDFAAIYADIAGMEYRNAMEAAAAFTRRLLEERLGDAEKQLTKIRNEDNRNEDKATWAAEAGKAQYEAWLEKNKDHPLVPNARYALGKLLVLARDYEAGRKYLRQLTELDQARSSICDDAQFWIARSYEDEGNLDLAEAEWGVLLRDYSWSRQAIENKAKHTPAGPVKFK